MKHSEFKKVIDSYFLSELDEDKKAEFEEHMLACASCRQELKLSQAVMFGLAECGDHLIDGLDLTPPKLPLWKRLKNVLAHPIKIPAIATLATIILLATLGVTVVNLWQRIPASELAIQYSTQDTISYWVTKFNVLSPKENSLSRTAHNIFKRLLRSSNPLQTIYSQVTPPLRDTYSSSQLIVIDDTKENIIFVLQDGHIVISSGVIEKCKRITHDQDRFEAGLAFILGHELAHQLNKDFRKHRLASGFGFIRDLPADIQRKLEDDKTAQTAREGIKKAENNADELGILIASLAGYDVAPLIGEEGFVVQWAMATEVATDEKHAQPKFRQAAIKSTIRKVCKEYQAFHLGLRLLQTEYYPEAIKVLEHFCKHYPCSEIYSNLGIAYHLRALSTPTYVPAYKRALIFYPEIPALTKTMSPSGGVGPQGKDLFPLFITKAIENYTMATKLNPYDSHIWHNLACAFADQGENLELALRYANQAIQLNPANYYAFNTRGTIYLGLTKQNPTGDFVKKWKDNALSDLTEALVRKGYSDPLYNLTHYYGGNGESNEEQFWPYLCSYLALDSYSDWAHELIAGIPDYFSTTPKCYTQAKKRVDDLDDDAAMKAKENIMLRTPGEHQGAFSAWGEPDDNFTLTFIPEYEQEKVVCEVWTYTTSAEGIMVSFIDKEAVLIEVGRKYTGSTSRGITIGDPISKVCERYYGSPQKVLWYMDRRVLIYPDFRIGFEEEDEKVKSWFLF